MNLMRYSTGLLIGGIVALLIYMAVHDNETDNKRTIENLTARIEKLENNH